MDRGPEARFSYPNPYQGMAFSSTPDACGTECVGYAGVRVRNRYMWGKTQQGAFPDPARGTSDSSCTFPIRPPSDKPALDLPRSEGPWWREMNRYHWFVFTVAALGWLFDTMDQQLFNLGRAPAIRTDSLGELGLPDARWHGPEVWRPTPRRSS